MIYHILAFLTVAIWGTTFVSTKILLAYGLTPAAIFAMRFSMAYAGIVLAQWIQGRSRATQFPEKKQARWRCRSWKDEGLMAIAGMTGGSMYFLTENTALQWALAGNVSLIVCLAPIVTAIFARVVNYEKKADAKLWAGSLVAFTGVAFVVYGSTGGGTATHPLLGNLLAFTSASVWAVYQLIIKPLGERYGILMLTRKVFGYGVLTILPVVLAEAPINRQVLSHPVVWGNLLFLGFVASLLCYAVWNKVAEKIGSLVSANYIYLNPLVTCVASYFILDEQLTPPMVAGGIAIIAGIYIAVAPRHPKPLLRKGHEAKHT